MENARDTIDASGPRKIKEVGDGEGTISTCGCTFEIDRENANIIFQDHCTGLSATVPFYAWRAAWRRLCHADDCWFYFNEINMTRLSIHTYCDEEDGNCLVARVRVDGVDGLGKNFRALKELYNQLQMPGM